MGAENTATGMGARGLPGRDGDSATAADFWRSNAGALLPDGGTDTTEPISRPGLVGIGNVPASTPAAQLDVARGGRSGADGRTAATPAYITGVLPSLGGGVTPPATPTGGAEFRHSNQTQGVGIGFDGLYATGSAPSQHFGLMQRGTGHHFLYWQTLNGGINYHNRVGPAIDAGGQGWHDRWFANGIQVAGEITRRTDQGFGGSATERFVQLRDSGNGFANVFMLRPSPTQANAFSAIFEDNVVNDAKLVLYGSNAAGFFGFGIKSATLASFVSATTGFHRMYAGPAPGTLLFSVSGVGNVTIDPNGTAGAGWNSPVLRFGGESENEGLRSQRTGTDRFAQDIEVYTAGQRRFAVLQNGRLYAAVVPTYATDAAAGTGGLAAGEVYKDATGALRIKL